MKRGEIRTVARAFDDAGEPRPSPILQDDAFNRIRVEPLLQNGLFSASDIMTDKVRRVTRQKLGWRIGLLQAGTMERVSAAVVLFLGFNRVSHV